MSKYTQDATDTRAVQLSDGTWSTTLKGPDLTGVARTEALAAIELAAELEARALRIRSHYTPQANRDALRLRDERARRGARKAGA